MLKMMRKNAVLLMQNIPSDSHFGDLKDFWNKYGTVRFLDYRTGHVKVCWPIILKSETRSSVLVKYNVRIPTLPRSGLRKVSR